MINLIWLSCHKSPTLVIFWNLAALQISNIFHFHVFWDFTWLLVAATPPSMIPTQLLLSSCPSHTDDMGLLWLAEKLMTALIGCSSVSSHVDFVHFSELASKFLHHPTLCSAKSAQVLKDFSSSAGKSQFIVYSPLSVSFFCYIAVMLHNYTTLLLFFLL